jgi:hypothetical protein
MPPIIIQSMTDLYSAINTPGHEDRTLILTPGTYILNSNQPNGGRLELQRDMSLVGVPGYPGLVIIDVSNLPESSYIWTPELRTGAIRMGLGYNSIESITIQNNAGNLHKIRSLIETDLLGTPIAHINISNTTIRGASIGLAISNRQSLSNNRVLKIDLYGNDISNNIVESFKSGIQIQNSHGVSKAVIEIKMKKNFLHQNGTGLRAFSAASDNSISIESRLDRIWQNRLGLALMGGLIGTGNQSNNNKTFFEGDNTSIMNNVGIPEPDDNFNPVGVFASAGAITNDNMPGTVNNNNLEIKFNNCIIAHNVSGDQMNVYGGYASKMSSSPVGNYNLTTLQLSNNILPQYKTEDSSPYEPSGTNKVKVL